MSSKKPSLISAFITMLMEFVDDMLVVFPDDVDIRSAKTSLGMLKSSNPKLIVTCWKEYVVNKYKSQLMSGDIDYFINKDYSSDVQSSEISVVIDRLREPIRRMSADDKAVVINYMQQLTILSDAIPID